MSFLNNMKLNNLQRDVNALQTQVQNIVATGTGIITTDIDLNSHSLTEVENIIFSSGLSIGGGSTGSTGLFVNNTERLITNSIYTDFNVNNHNVLGVAALGWQSGHLLQADMGQLTFDGTPIAFQNAAIAMGSNALTDVGEILFTAGDQLTVSNGVLTFQSSDVVTAGTIGSYIYSASENLNMNSHQITNCLSVATEKVDIGTDCTLMPGEGAGSLTLNNNELVTSANIESYISGSTSAGWTGIASSDLNMDDHSITNVSSLNFGITGISLQAGSCGAIEYGSNTLLFNPLGDNQTFDCNGNVIINALGISFVGNVAPIHSDGETGIMFGSDHIITSANIEEYISGSTSTGWVGLAGSDLNMNLNSITNALNVTATNFYLNGDTIPINSGGTGIINYGSAAIITAATIDNYIGESTFVGTATEDLNMQGHNIDNVTSIGITGATALNLTNAGGILQVNTQNVITTYTALSTINSQLASYSGEIDVRYRMQGQTTGNSFTYEILGIPTSFVVFFSGKLLVYSASTFACHTFNCCMTYTTNGGWVVVPNTLSVLTIFDNTNLVSSIDVSVDAGSSLIVLTTTFDGSSNWKYYRVSWSYDNLDPSQAL